MDKLYVVTRRDLPDGAQAAQSCHAVSAFAIDFPEMHRHWHVNDKNIVLVAVANEEELLALSRRALDAGLHCALFHEPDFGDALTGVAFIGEGAERITSSLPLTLKQRAA